VAEEFEVVLQNRAWDDNFAAARNECWEHVHGQWVLWLDAGEVLSAEDAAALKQFVIHEANISTAYMLLVTTPAAGGDLSGEQVGRIRLVPNHPDLEFAGRVRESLATSLAVCGIGVEGLPYRIRRSAAENDDARRRRRAERNLQLAAKEMEEIGPLPHLLNCLAEAHQALGDHRQAEELYRSALGGGSQSSERLEAYYGILVALEGRENCRSAQMTVCLEALEEYPLDAHLLCAMGGYLHGMGHPDLAARSLETAWKHGQLHPEVWHLSDIREIAAVSLSRCLESVGKSEEAGKVIDEALTASPDSQRLARRQAELRTAKARTLHRPRSPSARRAS
jgi:tetratricopeptide (TPR) repeat protein